MLWGLGIQFFLGIIVLKTQFGFDAFQWLGERVSEFLQHTDAGSIFVFGESYLDHFFAFSVRMNSSTVAIELSVGPRAKVLQCRLSCIRPSESGSAVQDCYFVCCR